MGLVQSCTVRLKEKNQDFPSEILQNLNLNKKLFLPQNVLTKNIQLLDHIRLIESAFYIEKNPGFDSLKEKAIQDQIRNYQVIKFEQQQIIL